MADRRRQSKSAPALRQSKAQPTTMPRRKQGRYECYSWPSFQQFSLKLFRGALNRCFEFLAQRRKETTDQMLGDTAQDPLADAGDEPADFAGTLKRQARRVRPLRLDLEARTAVAMAQRAGAGHLDAAGLRRLLVRQRDLAFERTAHRRDAQLHLDLVGVGRDFGHGLAAGNAARQHHGIVERLPEHSNRSLNGFDTADIELHGYALIIRTNAAPGRH